MCRLDRIPFSLFALLAVSVPAAAAEPKPAAKPAVVALFEDDTDLLIRQLTAVEGRIQAEKADRFSGTASIRVGPPQCYNPIVPGWAFPIGEDPGPGQYRYLRLAWKKVGGRGIMLQLCQTGTDWERRYVAGVNAMGWQARVFTDKVPAEWTVVTFDLFKDFGAFTLNGIALTPMDGEAGLYDHIYLGRTVEDLDRIDATGLRQADKPVALPPDKLAALWDDLGSPNDARSYLATWTLAAGKKEALPFLQKQLLPENAAFTLKQIPQLTKDLDDDAFGVRERASHQLEKLGDLAEPALRALLDQSTSAEVRRRATVLLAAIERKRDKNAFILERARILRAIKTLEVMDDLEARKVLEELAKGAPGDLRTVEAKAALKRLDRRPAGK